MQLSDLSSVRYIALESFRKNGEGVVTPLWIVEQDGLPHAWTGADSYKIMRIRRNSRVRVCKSDMRGTPESDWLEAQAQIIDEPGSVEQIRRKLAEKYGFFYRLIHFWGKVTGQRPDRVALRIEPAV